LLEGIVYRNKEFVKNCTLVNIGYLESYLVNNHLSRLRIDGETTFSFTLVKIILVRPAGKISGGNGSVRKWAWDDMYRNSLFYIIIKLKSYLFTIVQLAVMV